VVETGWDKEGRLLVLFESCSVDQGGMEQWYVCVIACDAQQEAVCWSEGQQEPSCMDSDDQLLSDLRLAEASATGCSELR
jgi:hypothetical protein